MQYFKNIDDAYVTGISTGSGDVEITQEEYDNILSVIRNRPVPDTGYDYRLTTELTWELVEVPVVEDDPEATEADYLAALTELGVTLDEEI